MINLDILDHEAVDICLNCQLPDCDETSEECRLYHPKGVEMDISGLNSEEKKAIAIEAKERGVRLVAEEKGIEWGTIRAWIGTYCRKPRVGKTDVNVNQKINQEIRHELKIDKINQNSIRIDPRLIDRLLSQETITEARAFWAGVRATRGL